MPASNQIDVAIIGAGPAGISAAIYAKRKALSVRIFESGAAGGQAAEAFVVENYPGIERLHGAELMQKMAQHLHGFGVEIEEAAAVTDIKNLGKGKGFELEINKGEEKAQAKAVILCTGSEYKMLNVPGEKEFYGKGVSYCATCDGPFLKGKTVAVIGSGNSGVNAALFFSAICKKTYLIEFLPKPTCDGILCQALSKSNVELLANTEVIAINGGKEVEKVKVKDRASGKEKEIAIDGVFIYAGMKPRNELAKKLGLRLDENGYIVVDRKKMASIQGVFAAGDIAGELAQIVVAAGSGAIAATSAFEYLKKQ
jgi:thioredoxin-disulfide reductase